MDSCQNLLNLDLVPSQPLPCVHSLSLHVGSPHLHLVEGVRDCLRDEVRHHAFDTVKNNFNRV